MKSTIIIPLLMVVSIGVSGCQGFDFKSLKSITAKANAKPSAPVISAETLGTLISEALVSSVDMNSEFSDIMKKAIENDPVVMAARAEYESARLAEGIILSKKDFQVNGLVYGGIEDVSDRTAGLAIVLNANRMLFDGGFLDAGIAAARFDASSAYYVVQSKLEERSHQLVGFWIDLERYETLSRKIEDRLKIVDPLIVQLEKIAEAGVGDVSQVASAQRTLSGILVKKTELTQKLEKSRLNFENAFSSKPGQTKFDSGSISELVPVRFDDIDINKAPFLLAEYESYRAAEANLVAEKTRRSYTIGFESRLSRPAGGSTADSDESVGVVLSKTLYNGDLFESQIRQAEAVVRKRASLLRATFKDGKRAVESAMQSIVSLEHAIELARDNAQVTSDEIAYLRSQLIIGGSTLDGVLKAEAQLYDAEANVINFKADKQKAEASVLASLGLLSQSFGIKP